MDILSNYHILTLSHKSVKIKNLGDFVISDLENTTDISNILGPLKDELNIDEILYLPTCNRVLFLFVTRQRVDNTFLGQFQQLLYPNLSMDFTEAAQHFHGHAAIRHLLEVASSVDSLIIGEREILRQLRTAYDFCRRAKLTGDSIRLAIKISVETAKQVYSNTKIGEKPVSVVSMAMRVLENKQMDRDAKILLVGAGQTNTLVAKFLKKFGYSNFTVFNRSLVNGQKLAKLLNGTAHSLDELASYQEGFDILIVCTASTEYIITPELFDRLNTNDQTKMLIDLSVPYNVDPIVGSKTMVDLIEIESLKEGIDQNKAFREKEVNKAKEIIEDQLDAFYYNFKGRQVEIALKDIPDQIKAIKSHAFQNVFKNEVSSLGPDAIHIISKMMDYMEKKCIDIPIQVAKENLAGVKSTKTPIASKSTQ